MLARCLLTLVALFGCVASASAQPVVRLDATQLDSQRVRLDDDWLFDADAGQAAVLPGYDDAGWMQVDPRLREGEMPASWDGAGWFRLHLAVDSALRHVPLILSMWSAGSADVYLDGRLLRRFDVDSDRDYVSFDFGEGARHVLAVRYASTDWRRLHRAGYAAGFSARAAHADAAIEEGVATRLRNARLQTFFVTLALAFALLHLILALFAPKARTHLVFVLFLLLYAGAIFVDFQGRFSVNAQENLLLVRLSRGIVALALLSTLVFIYTLFEKRPGRAFFVLALLLLGTGVAAVVSPVTGYRYLLLVAVLLAAEGGRVATGAVRAGLEDAPLLAAGFGVFVLFVAYDVLMDLGLIGRIGGVESAYQVGVVGLFAILSVYLARGMARTTERLTEEEMARRLIAADNARKTQELDDARRLQLSMLPSALPTLPHLDLAVHVQTATEVGGDYYDYHLADEGTLTLAVGDATGHGNKAGVMVAITKSLFQAEAGDPDLLGLLERFTRVMKQMRLGNLFMSLALVRLEGDHLTATVAGLPPLLIYRARTGEVEEVRLRGMPLGAFTDFPYRSFETMLEAGDTLLITTDGLVELFDEQREMLGLQRVKEVLREAGREPPEAVVEHLRRRAEAWRGERPPDDDVTFLVVQRRAVEVVPEPPPSGRAVGAQPRS